MLYAKSEIENAQIVTIDEELYKPIFRNLSKFKRYVISYWKLRIRVYLISEWGNTFFFKFIEAMS